MDITSDVLVDINVFKIMKATSSSTKVTCGNQYFNFILQPPEAYNLRSYILHYTFSDMDCKEKN